MDPRSHLRLGPCPRQHLSSSATAGKSCQANLSKLTDPNEGDPLPEDSESHLEVGDIRELADHALTAHDDPTADLGLGDQWRALDERVASNVEKACATTRRGIYVTF